MEIYPYAIDLKQGDLVIQLASDDADFIAGQMHRWLERFVDERYKPISLPPMPTASPMPESLPEPDSVSPTFSQEAVLEDPNRFLLEQIHELQAQVAALRSERQTSPELPPPAPLSPVMAAETLDILSAPAHPDFQHAFEDLDIPEPAPMTADFEQAVDNPADFVQNPASDHLADPLENTDTSASLPDNRPLSETVNNAPAFSVNAALLMDGVPLTVQDSQDDLDRIMDSLMTDLAGGATAVSEPMAVVAASTAAFATESSGISPNRLESVPLPLDLGVSDQLDEEDTDILFPASASEAAPADPEPPEAIENAFEAALTGLLEDEAAPPQEDLSHLSMDTLAETEVPPTSFDTAFEEAMQVPSSPEEEGVAPPEPEALLVEEPLHVESLAELCELATRAETGADYLVLSAYFLCHFQGTEKYALKDLNAQLVRSGLTPVNHGILETVISQGHVINVPDLTGTAQAAEYQLTPEGERYAASLIPR